MPPRPRLGEIPSHNAVPHGLKWAQLYLAPILAPPSRLLPGHPPPPVVTNAASPRPCIPAVHAERCSTCWRAHRADDRAVGPAVHGRTGRTVFHPLSESSESPRLTAGPCRPCDHVSRNSTADPPKQPAPGSNTLPKVSVSRSPRHSAKHDSLWRPKARKEVRRKPKSRADSPPGARST